jgi:hypothetical protein
MVLKKALPPGVSVNADADLFLLFVEQPPQPKVIATRLQLIGNTATPFPLVQWNDSPVHWSTWENKSVLSKLFPDMASRGRAAV